MKYLNEELGILKHFFPDIYLASSLRDYDDNVENISIPSRWKMLSPFGFWTYGNKSLICLQNLTLEPRDPDDHKQGYIISDLERELFVDAPIKAGITSKPSTKPSRIISGRQARIGLACDPIYREVRLFALKKFGEPLPDFDESKNISLRYMPQFLGV